MCVLIVEDNPRDMQLAMEVTRDAGFRSINAEPSLRGAERYLEEALEGERQLPDVIVLDLVLGVDSGYELLRLRCLTHSLADVKVIVWSEYYEHSREINSVFKINSYVGKWTGAAGLRRAIRDLNLPHRKDAEADTANQWAAAEVQETADERAASEERDRSSSLP